LAAQAIGATGSAPAAVPLIALLAYPDEGSRNSACIGLTGIGRGARQDRQCRSNHSSDALSRFVHKTMQHRQQRNVEVALHLRPDPEIVSDRRQLLFEFPVVILADMTATLHAPSASLWFANIRSAGKALDSVVNCATG